MPRSQTEHGTEGDRVRMLKSSTYLLRYAHFQAQQAGGKGHSGARCPLCSMGVEAVLADVERPVASGKSESVVESGGSDEERPTTFAHADDETPW